MITSGSIGFFDSGVGGLTIWKEVVKLLPFEETVYLADSKNAPYGDKSSQEILELCMHNVDFLISKGAKLIVVACNTATTQAIDELRERYSIPFIGIEPAVKPAVLKSKSKYIGVLATNGTIESDHFNRTKEHYANDVKVITQVGEGLVKGIENGQIESVELREVLTAHLNVLMRNPVDQIVLGCTHYPLLIPLIKKIIGEKVKLLDPGPSVAAQTKKILQENALLSTSQRIGSHQMYSTGKMEVLASIIRNNLYLSERKITYSSLYQSE